MNKLAYFRQKNKGAVALLLVVMITALTIISAAVISMVNTSDLMSSYSFSEAQQSSTETDTCLEDALWRLASSTDVGGTYYLNGAGINCYYQISDTISAGLVTVTSTASTTSNVGNWQNVVVAQINVSSTPIRINSYKNFNLAYEAIPDQSAYCGDASCNGSETCGDNDVAPSCNTDCGACPDTTAPAAVSTLALSGATTDSIDLDWTAPGDDNSTGTATSYDVRYSTASINEGNWSSATQATGEPSPSVAGSSESMTVSGLSSGTTYYFAIKTSDEIPNTSSISNVPSLATSSGGPTCGDGVKESPETCDYTGPEGTISGCFTNPVGCPARRSGCQNNCGLCVITCNSIGGL